MLRTVFVLLLTAGATTLGLPVSQGKAPVDEVKTIDVAASQFKFDPAVISVVEGDRVRLRVRAVDRLHGIAIKAFRVNVRIPKGGEAVLVEFVANRPGKFEIICSEYCGSGHGAMKGTLHVLPRRP